MRIDHWYGLELHELDVDWWVWTIVCGKIRVWHELCGLHVETARNSDDFARRVASAWAKMPEIHPWCCARSRLGELVSSERESISSRRNSLAWARVRSDFGVAPCLESRPGESDSPKQDYSLAQARSSSLSEFHCSVGLFSLFLMKWSYAKWTDINNCLLCMWALWLIVYLMIIVEI